MGHGAVMTWQPNPPSSKLQVKTPTLQHPKSKVTDTAAVQGHEDGLKEDIWGHF